MFDLKDVAGENNGYKPLIAGVSVPAVFVKAEFGKDKEGNLTQNLNIDFKGTATGNTGDFTFTVWASTFDTENQYYSVDSVKRTVAQIKHILSSFMTEDIVLKVAGKTWVEFATNIIKALSKFAKDVPCTLKIVLDKKNRNTFPLFPDFIVTEKTPSRVLRANTKINTSTGLPYDRFTPIEIAQTTVDLSTPSATPSAMFSMETEAPTVNGGPIPDDLPF